VAIYIRRPGSPMDEAPLGIAVSTDANCVRTDVVIPGEIASAMVRGVVGLMQHLPANPAGDNNPPPAPPPPMPGGGL
jgi:hypothetical protein